MKRGMLSMMILMLLLWAMHVFPTQAKAAEVHTHCVCGGSIVFGAKSAGNAL